MKKMQSSDLMDGLSKGLSADSDGNVTVGKDLEVDGKTKLNGGFEPIHIYKIVEDTGTIRYLAVYFEKYISADVSYCFYGDIRGTENEDNISMSVFGYYSLDDSDNTIYRLIATVANPGAYAMRLCWFDKDDDQRLVFKDFATVRFYRHNLKLNGNGTDYVCVLKWLTNNDLIVDSVQDLRTLLGNPNQFQDVASAPNGDLYGVIITPSVAKIKKAGSDTLIDITSVHDSIDIQDVN